VEEALERLLRSEKEELSELLMTLNVNRYFGLVDGLTYNTSFMNITRRLRELEHELEDLRKRTHTQTG
jgi:hypothetical protein